ncbi:5629_t:CDS:2 [Gigaspora margarita]|uniref:5629_t:CDS:1 n=1 Tax=Gigaspora margarita TaxID=4874 RepID=A0ABN7VG90_GIGMA|nr:5629_t:CDS:2 [Gigaspora margarita]
MAEDGEQRVILNVGGIKYETYRSTLAKYPETLLGTMFSSRNEALLHTTNGNEYFFDRNGDAFRYIMTFYRDGKISCDKNLMVNESELATEIDYFQIPSYVNHTDYDLAYKKGAKILNEFIDLIENIVYENICLFETIVNIVFHKNGKQNINCTNFDFLQDLTKKEFRRFDGTEKNTFKIGYRILNVYKNQIMKNLNYVLPGEKSISLDNDRYIIEVKYAHFNQVAKLSRMITNE